MKKITWLLLALVIMVGLSVTSSAQAEDLEKISSPEQVKNYRVMKNENGVLYGVRLQAGTNVTSNATTEEKLEKIPSLDQLKNFRVVKKEGNALYGIRINNQEGQSMPYNKKENDGEEINKGSKAETVLEKIGAPQLIPLYEKIKQVGNALWGVKKQSTTTSNIQKRVVVRAEAASCVSTAITAKDSALSSNIMDASNALVAAIATRSTCQQAALASTEKQFVVMDVCVKAFSESFKEIQEQQKSKHKQTWDSYRLALKACQPASSDDSGTELIIEDGSEKLAELVSDLVSE